MDKLSQRMKIFEYCQEHGSITTRDAAVALNINSPSKRISEIRHDPNFIVDSVQETRTNSYGETVRYLRYFIKVAT